MLGHGHLHLVLCNASLNAHVHSIIDEFNEVTCTSLLASQLDG